MFKFLFRRFFLILVIGGLSSAQAYKMDVTKAENPKLAKRSDQEERKRRFSYETVKVKHGLPSEITQVLRCIFNHECSRRESMESRRQNYPGAMNVSDNPGFAEVFSEKASCVENSVSKSLRKRKHKQTIGLLPSNEDSANAEFSANRDLKPGTTSAEKEDHLDHIETSFWPNDHNSLIFIGDASGRIGAIKKVIASLDHSEPQVRIESRIVRANKDWSRGMGILWGGRNNQFGGVKTDRSSYWGITGNQSGAPANTATGANLKQTVFLKGVQQPVSRTITSSEIPSRLAVNLPASVANIGDIMGLGMQFGLLANQYITELDFRLQIGEAQGQAKTVARPNIQVSDGKNAVIKSGSVLNVQTSSPQWGTNSHLVSVDLKLQVIPKILPDSRIRMVITVTDNEPNPFPTTGELYLEREAHTTMTVANGETCVIGGIIRDTVIGRREGWPGLMDVPILGMLFSNKSKAKETDELLVFISPSIVFKPN
jgi:type II secretory pathway component HofQ